MQGWHESIESFIALFVVADPIAVIPIFISLTTNHTEHEKRRIANIAALTVVIVLTVSIFVGESLLGFFGMGIPAFRVAGGILILLMAIAMLQARTSRAAQTPQENVDAAAKDDIAVVPIGIPLVAGPGAIGTIIIYGHLAANWLQTGILIFEAVLVAASLWASL